MDETLKALAQGGGIGAVVAAVLVVGGRIALKVVDRLIAAIDRLGVKHDEHTKADLASHADLREDVTKAQAELREEVVKLRAEVGTVMRLADEQQAAARGTTPIRGVPFGEYSHARKRSEGDKG